MSSGAEPLLLEYIKGLASAELKKINFLKFYGSVQVIYAIIVRIWKFMQVGYEFKTNFNNRVTSRIALIMW